MKNKLLIFSVIGLAAILLLSLNIQQFTDICNEQYRHDKSIHINSIVIGTEIAKTNERLRTGLSEKQCIKENQGMLFVFDKSDLHTFWMKDMEFPIDMIWINEDHKVVTVKSNISPDTYPQTYVSSKPAKYVLELKAGRAVELGIKEGTELKL